MGGGCEISVPEVVGGKFLTNINDMTDYICTTCNDMQNLYELILIKRRFYQMDSYVSACSGVAGPQIVRGRFLS